MSSDSHSRLELELGSLGAWSLSWGVRVSRFTIPNSRVRFENGQELQKLGAVPVPRPPGIAHMAAHRVIT